MTRDNALATVARVILRDTGYGPQEADAYARGVVDAFTLHRPGYFLAFDEPMVEQLAQQLVAL